MKRLLYLISPTGFETVMYGMLSTALLMLASYKEIFQQFDNQPKGIVATSIQLNPREFSNLFESQNWLAVASTAFFWSIVGLVLAFVGWAFINAIIDFYNTYIVSTNFMHPRNFAQTSWWGDYLLRISVRSAAGCALILYAFMLSRYIFPFCQDIFRKVVNDIGNPVRWLGAVGAVLLLAVSLHVIVVCFRLVAMKPRILDNR